MDFSLIGAVLGIVQFIGTIIIFMVVKFNDLAHIDKKLGDLSNKQDKCTEKIGILAEEVSYLKGKVEVKSRQYAKKKK